MPLHEYACCLLSLYSIIFVGFCKISYLCQVKANFRFSCKVNKASKTNWWSDQRDGRSVEYPVLAILYANDLCLWGRAHGAPFAARAHGTRPNRGTKSRVRPLTSERGQRELRKNKNFK